MDNNSKHNNNELKMDSIEFLPRCRCGIHNNDQLPNICYGIFVAKLSYFQLVT